MEVQKLSFGKKILYGFGDLGTNFTYTLVTSFIMIYLTDSIGMNSAIIGTLILVSKITDAISDIFFGNLIDKTHTRMGKARPWMLRALFPLAICNVLLFSIPKSSPEVQYAYFFIVYTLLNSFCYTAEYIAYSTLSALVTRNSTERVQIGTIRLVFGLLAAILISSFTPILVTTFGGGAVGWRFVSILYSGIMIICILICIYSQKELPEESINQIPAEVKDSHTSLLGVITLLFKNRFYLLLLGINLTFYVMSGVSQGVGIYYAKYVLNNENMNGLLTMVGMLPMVVGLVFTPVLVKKWGIYKVNLYGMSLTVVFSIISVIAGYTLNLPLLLVSKGIAGFSSSTLSGTMSALTGSAADYTYKKDKIHIEGAMFSCISFGTKVGGGIGNALFGGLLALGGYVGTAAVQTPEAINMLIFMFTGVPTVLYAVAALLLKNMNIEKATAELDGDTH